MIAGHFKIAARTPIDSLTQGERLPVTTPRTVLRRIGRVDFDGLPASFSRFAEQQFKEPRPRRVTDAFRQTAVVEHPVNGQVFNRNQPESIDDLAGFLMGEISPLESDPLMNARDTASPLCPLRRPFLGRAQFALGFGQLLFGKLKEARVLDPLAGREVREAFQPDINPDDCGRSDERGARLYFAREGRVPLARGRAAQGAGFWLTLKRTMKARLDLADLGELQMPALERAARRHLREGEAVIPMRAPESRIARLFARLEAAKEGLKGQIEPEGNVLQNLRVNTLKLRPLLFEFRQSGLLRVEVQTFAFFFVGCLSFLKQAVVQPTALMEHLRQRNCLLLGGIQPVLKTFTHEGQFRLNWPFAQGVADSSAA
jgi:hypothetical protein